MIFMRCLLCLGEGHAKAWCSICKLFTKTTQVTRDLCLKQHLLKYGMRPVSAPQLMSDQWSPSGSVNDSALHSRAGISPERWRSHSSSSAPRKRSQKTDQDCYRSPGDPSLSKRSTDQRYILLAHGMVQILQTTPWYGVEIFRSPYC